MLEKGDSTWIAIVSGPWTGPWTPGEQPGTAQNQCHLLHNRGGGGQLGTGRVYSPNRIREDQRDGLHLPGVAHLACPSTTSPLPELPFVFLVFLQSWHGNGISDWESGFLAPRVMFLTGLEGSVKLWYFFNRKHAGLCIRILNSLRSNFYVRLVRKFNT
jgi:hypothetical protein